MNEDELAFCEWWREHATLYELPYEAGDEQGAAKAGWIEATKREREGCAETCEANEWLCKAHIDCGETICHKGDAAAIRARGKDSLPTKLPEGKEKP